MKDLPKYIFLVILLIYPVFCAVMQKGLGIKPHYIFGVLNLVILTLVMVNIYRARTNLIIPYYVQIFGLFVAYTMLTEIFISDYHEELGTAKFLYTNYFLLTLIAFLIIENTSFPARWIKISKKVLMVTLVFAAIVSVVQIYEPLFLVRTEKMVQDLSFERIEGYYQTNYDQETNSISRFLKGYRLSIFSFINEMSVGLDALAIFSILLALRMKKWLNWVILIFAAGTISILSSSRWIMLNFIVIASQTIWMSKNWISSSIKYIVFGIVLLVVIGGIASIGGVDIEQFGKDRLLSDSAYTRFIAIEVFAEVFPDNPIWGTGGVDTPEMERLIRGRSSQIHVGYLKLFYYYGLVGGSLYLAFLVSLLIRTWRMARKSQFWGGFYAILAFAVANLTLVELDLFYYGILLALIFSKHLFEESSSLVLTSSEKMVSFPKLRRTI